MTRFIGLLGATGYTGRLVADELASRNITHRRGGRSRAKLDALPPTPNAETLEVDASNPVELDAFLDGIDALITTVGPFAELGMPVVEAAVRNNCHYVDSTGEPDFMSDVYAKYADAPVAVVPACGYDYLPSDCAAALAARKLGEGDEPIDVVVAYDLKNMRPSRGTTRTAVGGIASSVTRMHRIKVSFPEGEKDAVAVPLGERLTVPRHVPNANVTTAFVTRPGVAAVADFLGPTVGAFGALLRGAAPVVRRMTDRMSDGPDEATRSRARFRILAEARRGPAKSAVLVEGSDVYKLTAVLLVEAALQVQGQGAMAPAQALEPAEFLDAVSGSGLISWRYLD